MLIKRGDIYTLSSLEKLKNINCAFSTTNDGSIKDKNNRSRWLKSFGISGNDVVQAKQVHGGRVQIVSKKDSGRIIDNCDGLITRDKGVYLMILTADCVPIVVIDPEKEIVAIAHAGWKGTVAGIAKNLIKKLKDYFGSKPESLFVGFGPSIEPCHYEVDRERISVIKKAGLKDALLKNVSGRVSFDLKKANVDQLVFSGILKKNIDMSAKICTYENPDFYSFCRDKTDKRTAAIIGMKNDA